MEKSGNTLPDQKIVVMTEFVCSDCSQLVSAKLPKLRVINCPEFSSVTFVHQLVKCPCGSYFMPTLNDLREDLKIRFNWVKVQVKETSKKEISTEAFKSVKTQGVV